MSNVETIISTLGGIRPLARGLGLWPSVVQGWKERGYFPKRREKEILKYAWDNGIKLNPEDFVEMPERGRGKE